MEQGKEWKPYEKYHVVYDLTSLIITVTMIVLGAIFLGEKLEERFERDLFIIIMVEMLLLGLILKATYYLYMHPWEDMNPRHKTNVLWHKVTVYILGKKALSYA